MDDELWEREDCLAEIVACADMVNAIDPLIGENFFWAYVITEARGFVEYVRKVRKVCEE